MRLHSRALAGALAPTVWIIKSVWRGQGLVRPLSAYKFNREMNIWRRRGANLPTVVFHLQWLLFWAFIAPLHRVPCSLISCWANHSGEECLTLSCLHSTDTTRRRLLLLSRFDIHWLVCVLLNSGGGVHQVVCSVKGRVSVDYQQPTLYLLLWAENKVQGYRRKATSQWQQF